MQRLRILEYEVNQARSLTLKEFVIVNIHDFLSLEQTHEQVKVLGFACATFCCEHEAHEEWHVKAVASQRPYHVDYVLQIIYVEHIFNARDEDTDVEIKLYLLQDFEEFD